MGVLRKCVSPSTIEKVRFETIWDNPDMRHILRWGGVAAGLLFTFAANATSVPRLSFEELTDRSEVIATGQITRSWSDWDTPHKHIWTHYELAVTAAYKGRSAQTVVISEPGGVVGNLGSLVAGSVSYQTGQKVIVFLQRMPNGYLRTTGWGQGQYTVDPAGHLHASEALRQVELQPSAAGGLASLNGISVSDMTAKITARVRRLQGAQ
jgi:hypothetical protein